eukprot:Plantae.Rhodophyta-Palmaria_palmata.ctg15373.p1 GENE.Plantae.Rhodophyta-Palmaria_palmata.ctg15373~~Plantae.Rhodophyta-Palmaria_palmata.ctg15373.p1  ORF type:complete len:112 (+),score=17.51 Plantae.Rhodophyta-Palmaria_palmata.ctg15373:832-1167(+)
MDSLLPSLRDVCTGGKVYLSRISTKSFREMVSGFFEAGGGKGKVKYLTRAGLTYYLREEFEMFKMYLQHIIARAKESAKRNKFAQELQLVVRFREKSGSPWQFSSLAMIGS